MRQSAKDASDWCCLESRPWLISARTFTVGESVAKLRILIALLAVFVIQNDAAAQRYHAQFEWGKAVASVLTAQSTTEALTWESVAELSEDGTRALIFRRLNTSLETNSPPGSEAQLNVTAEVVTAAGGAALFPDTTPQMWFSENVEWGFVLLDNGEGHYTRRGTTTDFFLNHRTAKLMLDLEVAYADYPSQLAVSIKPDESSNRFGFSTGPTELEPGVFFNGIGMHMDDVIVDYVQTPPGDANNDGVVQFADFVILANNFGTYSVSPSPVWEQGNFDGDREVGFADFALLAENFGTSSVASQAVPEPSSFTVACLACLGLLARYLPRR